MRRRGLWRQGCAGVIAAGLITLVVACSLIGAGLQRGLIAQPQLDGRVGALRVVGFPTWNARCPPFVGCEPTRKQSYVIWFIVEQPGPAGVTTSPHRFVAIPINPW